MAHPQYNKSANIWVLKSVHADELKQCRDCKKDILGFQNSFYCKEKEASFCRECEAKTKCYKFDKKEDSHIHYCISEVQQV